MPEVVTLTAETTLEFEVACDFDFNVLGIITSLFVCVGVTSSSHFSAGEMK